MIVGEPERRSAKLNVNMRWRFTTRMVAALLLVLAAFSFVCLRQRSDPVTITVSKAAGDSGRVRFEVHNRSRRAVMLSSLDLLGRVGTNWAFVGHVPLGDTKTNVEIFSIEVGPPIGRKEWKAKLVYEPQAAGFKLLKWRLQEAWRTRSVAQGFRLTGWDASQYAYSEVLHQ